MEYLRNYGLSTINASAAFEAGATGAGILVGVIDTGIDFGNDDLQGRISAQSVDVVVGRNQPQGQDDHGTLVSGVIAANFNNYGTIGVAYGSTILSVRADISDCDDPDDTACFRDSDLTRAIDVAVARGARVINLSLGGETPLGPAFEAALLRAVNAGVAIVAAAGNESGVNPTWPGRYASDPRFGDGIIVVGSVDQLGQISSFSNRAGVSAGRYVVAPGEQVISGCDGDSCFRINGTSFAAPHVAGAVALLLDAFPNLSGAEAIDILIQTASDLGASGSDTTFGQGLINLETAFQPVGVTTIAMSDGGVVTVTALPEAHLGSSFGDAVEDDQGLMTVARDSFERLFTHNLAAAYPGAPRRSFQPPSHRTSQTTRLSMDGPAGLRLGFTASADVPEPEPVAPRFTPFDAPWMGLDPRQEAMVQLDAGPLALTVWNGLGGARSPFATGAGDGFAALAQADRAVRGDLAFGPVSVTTEFGAGDRLSAFRAVEEDAASYGRVGLRYGGERFDLTVAGGVLDERLGPLGAYMPSDSPYAMEAATSFAAVGGSFRLGATRTFSGEFGWGRTEADGRVLSLSAPALSSTWRFGVSESCVGWGLGCRSLRLELSQPLRVYDGAFSAVLADIPLDYFDPVTFSRRSVSASPSGRQLDLALRSLHALPDGSLLALEAVAIRQENHRRDAEPGFALLGSWRRPF